MLIAVSPNCVVGPKRGSIRADPGPPEGMIRWSGFRVKGGDAEGEARNVLERAAA